MKSEENIEFKINNFYEIIFFMYNNFYETTSLQNNPAQQEEQNDDDEDEDDEDNDDEDQSKKTFSDLYKVQILAQLVFGTFKDLDRLLLKLKITNPKLNNLI